MTENLSTGSNRRHFIGGSDARIIMGADEEALLRLWREKRGEAPASDLSGNLVVQLGVATEELNRRWFEKETGKTVKDVQAWVRHKTIPYMAATLDGRIDAADRGREAVFEAKFMLPWSFSEEAAAVKHAAQLQHNMLVSDCTTAMLSIVTGGGQFVAIEIAGDPLYQHLLITAERKFWRCVETGEAPRPFGIEPPRPKILATQVVDMTGSNAWAEMAALFRETRAAFLDHERAKSELKNLMPEEAKEAFGYGIRARRSKSGAVSLALLDEGGLDAHR